MRFGRRYIALRSLRNSAEALGNRLSRIQHFRGHGVHSPFVYNLVRQVFMRHVLFGDTTVLRDALLEKGVSVRRSVELQNLMTYCGYRSFAVTDAGGVIDADLVVVLRGADKDVVQLLVSAAAVHRRTVVVMDPYADIARTRMCRILVAAHNSTTVDNRGYLLLFNDHKLPKQHFKI